MRRLALAGLCVALAACNQGGGDSKSAGLSAEDSATQKLLQEQLLDAKAGTVIEIPEECIGSAAC
jgi:hypothetical protein